MGWFRHFLTVLPAYVACTKTGSIDRVNSLSGYIERPDGHPLTFSIEANAHAVGSRAMLAQIDSIVVEIGRTR